ncbi:MAG: hypothetical protein HC916_20480 [Coleofasciculaceae cyanobacterium SM2_1_6]|nr:hypothetical protein [Coleofasciculaceae cyanobacterium SM2_1_6]
MTNLEIIGKLAQPKLTLFAFHLFSNLAKGDKQPRDDADHLWQKCVDLGKELKTIPNIDSQIAQISQDSTQNNQQSDYLQLYQLDNGVISFETTSQPDQLSLKGGIYPLQLHDTYALDFTLLAPKDTIEIAQIRNLNFQGCFLPRNIQASLGQTILLFVKPIDFSGELQDVALACINSLFPDTESSHIKPYLIGKGTLLGSPIFEFDNDQEDPQLKCHILVWFNSHEKTAELEDSGNYYRPLINLLCCRSKILYAYHQADRCNQEARKIYSQLERKIEELDTLEPDTKKRLKQLEKLLIEFPKLSLKYARYLRDIQLHLTTIETNVFNYNYEIKQLQKHSLKDIDKLDFLQGFSKHSRQTFQKQIGVNKSYLTAGQQLFEQTIASIRGIVEIEQAESDRSLERTIQILGTGLGAGGIVASAISGHVEKPLEIGMPKDGDQFHPAVLSIFWSFLVFILVGGIVGWFNGAIPAWLSKLKQTDPKLRESHHERSLPDKTKETRQAIPRDSE